MPPLFGHIFLSLNKIELLLARLENESHQQKQLILLLIRLFLRKKANYEKVGIL
jgi:hypothetical protein